MSLSKAATGDGGERTKEAFFGAVICFSSYVHEQQVCNNKQLNSESHDDPNREKWTFVICKRNEKEADLSFSPFRRTFAALLSS